MRAFENRELRKLFWTFLAFAGGIVVLALAEKIGRGEEPADAPTLLVFHAQWCQPCRDMQPVIDAVEHDGYAVKRVDIDRDVLLAQSYRVASVPTFIVVNRGVEVDRVVGRTSVERLKMKLKTKEKTKTTNIERRPTPAWRYAEAVGHRSAVVRVFCKDAERVRSIGSGVLVSWGGRVIILTARHVVQDAKQIVVELSTRRSYSARVLKVDIAWDCAALELGDNPSSLGVEPARLELGAAAVQRKGNRLESCGYGADGRLAVNSGRFLGYRRSSERPNSPPDDWFEISGPARLGDSGGPIFNERGRVVGILWGTNGEVVVGVQAGRVHRVLSEAIKVESAKPQAALAFHPTAYEPDRQPTPPMDAEPATPLDNLPETPAKSGCCPGGSCLLPGPELDEPVAPAAKEKTNPILPWRGNTQNRDDRQDARIDALIRLNEQKARDGASPQGKADVSVSIGKQEVKKEASPLVAGLCILAAVAVGFVIYFAMPKK